MFEILIVLILVEQSVCILQAIERIKDLESSKQNTEETIGTIH